MPKPFYNATEAELAAGAANVIAIVTPDPALYGATAAIMASYSALANDYRSLLALATAPATRTSVAVTNKNAAKRALKTASINLARIAASTGTVTNAMLLELGANPRPAPAPRAVPPTPPTINVLAVAGRLASLRVYDAASGRRGLPFGAHSASLYSYVGPTPPTDPREYHFEGVTTRAKAQILFPNSVPSGATVWLSATWVSRRGQTGVGSAPVSLALQGGALPAAA